MDELTKPQKQAAAKALLDLNYSAAKIGELLGVDRTTVYRYSQEPDIMEMQHFATEIKTMFMIRQQELLAKVLNQIDENLKDEWKSNNLALLFKVLSDSLK